MEHSIVSPSPTSIPVNADRITVVWKWISICKSIPADDTFSQSGRLHMGGDPWQPELNVPVVIIDLNQDAKQRHSRAALSRSLRSGCIPKDGTDACVHQLRHDLAIHSRHSDDVSAPVHGAQSADHIVGHQAPSSPCTGPAIFHCSSSRTQ